nr:response regulator [Anaerolineae bacterium]
MSQTSHILVADDNLSAREVLRGLLTKFGYELTFATNGQEALAEAKRIVPDVILLDVMMPGLTGFQVCERIRSDAQLAEVPILLITALDDRESRLQGIKAGADDFISKPFDPVELSARVQTILQLNRYRRLHTERSKFEWVVEQSGYGYLILNRQQVITYANTQARQYLGLPENSEVSSSLPFLSEAQRHFHCEPEDVWQTWPNLPDSTPAYLVRPATDEADSFWLQVEQMEMVGGGDQKYLIHLRDVTEEINNRRLTWTFQSQVGHKLRTPSMLITGFLDVMLEDETLSKEQHVHLKSIYNNALRLQEGIQDILEYLDVPHSARHGEPIYRLSELPPLVEKIQADLGLAS